MPAQGAFDILGTVAHKACITRLVEDLGTLDQAIRRILVIEADNVLAHEGLKHAAEIKMILVLKTKIVRKPDLLERRSARAVQQVP